MRPKRLLLAGLIALLLLTLLFNWSATAQTSTGYAITGWTTAGGGGASTGGGYSLSASIGQPAAGRMVGGGYALTAGFWPNTATQPYKTYLPLLEAE